MQLIGITVFSDGKTKKSDKNHKAPVVTPVINTMDVATKLSLGKRVKAEAIQYVKNQGITIGKDVSYAVRQEKKDEYWANPNIALLSKDWYIVLNDNKNNLLTVLMIPANTFGLKSAGKSGLVVRNDRPDNIDLNITCDNLIDQRSKIDFKPYVLKKIPY